jgi:hypothetical protein
MDEVLLKVRASPARLWFGVISQAALGTLLLWIALAQPPAELGWRVVLLVVGGAAFWGAVRLRRIGAREIILTRTEVADSKAGVVFRIDEVTRVSRGVFAFKPARGFAVLLARPGPWSWAPGLWWRVGRRVGVGGMMTAAESKLLAEVVDALVAERRAS